MYIVDNNFSTESIRPVALFIASPNMKEILESKSHDNNVFISVFIYYHSYL